MPDLPVFDCDALISALDAQRAERGLGWTALASQLWEQSAELNAQRGDQALCPGALVRTTSRGSMSCQYALILLRWIRRAPEDFLTGPVVRLPDVQLPEAGPDQRLRWNLGRLHAALDDRRRARGLTWAQLGGQIECTPNRLTNLRGARLADMNLTMRVAQWLAEPAARFIEPARW